jgi:PAS domain S-box-containing protein
LRLQSSALNAAANAIVITRRDGAIEWTNPAFTTLTGYALSEVIGKNPRILKSGMHDQAFYKNMWDTILSGQVWRGEMINRRKDGALYAEELTITPLQNERGEVEHFIAIKHDVTERKKIEETLLFLLQGGYSDENFFQSLARYLAGSLDMDYVCIDRLTGDRLSAQTVAIYYDDKFEDNLEYALKDTPCGEVVGSTVCVFPERVRFMFPQDAVLQEMEAESYVGTTLWSSHGQPIGLIAVIGRKPLTPASRRVAEATLKIVAVRAAGELERKQAEEKLRKSEERFRDVTFSMADWVWETDENGVYTYSSRKGIEWFGESREDVIGKTPFDFMPPEEAKRVAAIFAEVVARKASIKDLENWNVTKDGERICLLANAVPILDDDGNLKGYRGVDKDVTARKSVEESLMLAHDQAVKANQLKSQLIAKVSHELRTPLSSVLGFAELLKYNIFGGELNPEQMEAADQIIDSAHYLTDMVNEFLDEAEIETKSLVLDHKAFIPAEVLKHVETTMSIIANKKGLTLKTNLAPDLPETLWGDARRLQQILINLTNNAIKFTRAGEVGVSMTRHAENQWALQVRDTGVGIPKDALELIFEPFKQMDNAITRENQGTGLGLTITKQLAELMSGRIFVESEVGKGSAFTIILPLQIED